MIANYATAADFASWEAKAKVMTDAELLYSARDARAAAEAMRGWNPIAEGRYDDEAFTYGDEIRRRRVTV
jgi:transposase-like protein